MRYKLYVTTKYVRVIRVVLKYDASLDADLHADCVYKTIGDMPKDLPRRIRKSFRTYQRFIMVPD